MTRLPPFNYKGFVSLLCAQQIPDTTNHYHGGRPTWRRCHQVTGPGVKVRLGLFAMPDQFRRLLQAACCLAGQEPQSDRLEMPP
jgi:hypothetical protein